MRDLQTWMKSSSICKWVQASLSTETKDISLARHEFLTKGCVSHCVCRVGHANTLIWGICVFLHHYTHTITHDFFLPLPSHIQQK